LPPKWNPNCLDAFAVIERLAHSVEQYKSVVSSRQKLVASGLLARAADSYISVSVYQTTGR